jgi:di/tricarboxylate transporter
MLFFGQNLLAPKDSRVERKKDPWIDDLLEYHQIAKYEYLMRIPAHSDLVERTVGSMQLNAQHHVVLLAVESGTIGRKREISAARPETVLHAEDGMLLIGTPEHATVFAEKFSLQIIACGASRRRAFFQVVGIAEVMLNPHSPLIGKSLKETQFQTLFHSMVLGIRRKGQTLADNITDIPLAFGDVLLVCGAWTEILRLEENRDQYLLLTLPEDHNEVIPARDKKNTALAILGFMILAMALDILPPVTAVLAATAALVLARCVPLSGIYEVVDWRTVVMLAGILPLALAMQKTGITAQVSEGFLALFTHAGAPMVLAGLFVVTALPGLFLSNTAAAVLMAPLAVDVAFRLHINPQACAMTMAIACSAAFISPFGSPVNALVREPGGYSFKDYAVVGAPLFLLSLIAAVALCWVLYL